jgi:hypothetical protein
MTSHRLLRTLAALFVFAVPVAEAEPFPHPPAPDPHAFALMAWGETRTEAADLQAMREAGLNITGFCMPADVPHVRAAGLACLLRDPKLSAYDWAHPPDDADVRRDAVAFAKVASDQTVLGVLLNDEPQSVDMVAIAAVAHRVREATPRADPIRESVPVPRIRERLVRGLRVVRAVAGGHDPSRRHQFRQLRAHSGRNG